MNKHLKNPTFEELASTTPMFGSWSDLWSKAVNNIENGQDLSSAPDNHLLAFNIIDHMPTAVVNSDPSKPVERISIEIELGYLRARLFEEINAQLPTKEQIDDARQDIRQALPSLIHPMPAINLLQTIPSKI